VSAGKNSTCWKFQEEPRGRLSAARTGQSSTAASIKPILDISNCPDNEDWPADKVTYAKVTEALSQSPANLDQQASLCQTRGKLEAVKVDLEKGGTPAMVMKVEEIVFSIPNWAVLVGWVSLANIICKRMHSDLRKVCQDTRARQDVGGLCLVPRERDQPGSYPGPHFEVPGQAGCRQACCYLLLASPASPATRTLNRTR